MNKVKKKEILSYLFLFLVIFIYNSIFDTTYDHIIDFTHCYSISNGLKIYQDFNIVIGPIYPIFVSLFLMILGKNLLVFNIINSLFVVGIYRIIKKDNPNSLSLLLFILFQNVLIAKYNTFSLLLFYIIYYLEKKEDEKQDYLIGIFLSLLFFTKISIGIFLIIPTLLIHYKNPKKIRKRFLSFILLSSIILFLLLITNILPGFMNYTILGLFDFRNSTSSIHGTHNFNFLIIVLIIIGIYLFFHRKKDKMSWYLISFLIMSYPIFDTTHILLAIFPTLVYFIDTIPRKENTENIFKGLAILSYVLVLFTIKDHSYLTKMDCKHKYCSNNNIYNETFQNVHIINSILEKKYQNYRKFYFNYDAYFYKLDLKENINKYDFIWEGNMGYQGEENYQKEIHNICQKEKCLFVLDNRMMNQKKKESISMKLIQYVRNNYQKELVSEIPYQNIEILKSE